MDDAIAEGASEYFIGSMVVYPEKKKGVQPSSTASSD